MTNLIASSDFTVVIGMGQTGLSVADFLARKQQKFMMMDTRPTPPNLDTFKQRFPDVACVLGSLDGETLKAANKIIVSPGIDLKEAAIQSAIASGVTVVGDIQLFIENINAPIIGITGSNGKSTVTTLVGKMLKDTGSNVAVAGNIGLPVLDLVDDGNDYEWVVLELSSFQLEATAKLNAEVAIVLNMCEDHMDRYANMHEYLRAKQRIFFGARKIVVNRQDALTQPPLRNDQTVISFGLDKPDLNQFGVIEEDGQEYLAFGLQKLINTNELRIRGSHNVANALAALAIGKLIELPMEDMLQTLRNFTGLPHRCEWVRDINGVTFINDSKGTNVGATIAAINGLATGGNKIVLIAGGEGKGADFSPLQPVFVKHLRALVAIGRDAKLLLAVAQAAAVHGEQKNSLVVAVQTALDLAKPGDIVLLSPACASFDMFKNYQDRGDQFLRAVEALAA